MKVIDQHIYPIDTDVIHYFCNRAICIISYSLDMCRGSSVSTLVFGAEALNVERRKHGAVSLQFYSNLLAF